MKNVWCCDIILNLISTHTHTHTHTHSILGIIEQNNERKSKGYNAKVRRGK